MKSWRVDALNSRVDKRTTDGFMLKDQIYAQELHQGTQKQKGNKNDTDPDGSGECTFS